MTGGAGTLALVVAASLLMIVTSVASAAEPATSTSLKAPYKGTYVQSVDSAVNGCHKARVGKPFFKLKSGAGGFAASNSARWCKNHLVNDASTQGGFEAYIRLPATNGTSLVNATMTYRISGSLSLKAGTCTATSASFAGYCYEESYVYGYAGAEVVDWSTGTYYGSSTSFPGWNNYTTNRSTCSAGVCSSATAGASGTFSVSGTYTWSIALSSPMVSTDTYILLFYAYIDPYSQCDTYQAASMTSCAASTAVNAATAGNGIDLSAIVET